MKNNIPAELRSASGIYEIRNVVNNKVYVGSTTNFSKRLRTHKSGLRHGKKSNMRLLYSYQKYGIDAFTFNVLEQVAQLPNETKEVFTERLLSREFEYMTRLGASDRNTGFNIRIDPATNDGAVLLRRKYADGLVVRPAEYHNIGSKSPHAKINESTAKEVKILLRLGYKPVNVAKCLSLATSTVYPISHGEAWNHVRVSQADIDNYSVPVSISTNNQHHLNLSDVKKIKYLLTQSSATSIISFFVTGRKGIALHIKAGNAHPTVRLTQADIMSFEQSGLLEQFTEYHTERKKITAAIVSKNSPRGSANKRAKLTESDVLQIKSLLLKGRTLASIAERFGVDFTCISLIKRGKSWSHLTGFPARS